MTHLKNHRVYLILAAFILFLLTSCVHSKNIGYFQNIGDTTHLYVQDSIRDAVTHILPGDLLDIYVSSASAIASAPFNLGETAPSASASSLQATNASRAFRVESDSTIDYPVLGRIKIAGMTTAMLADTLTARLQDYLKAPHVHIHFLNFKITVLGEVTRPAEYTFVDEKVTLTDVIAMAGDLTLYGRRDNVTVIRQEGGKRIFARVDLRSTQLFLSPYYYLRQNDIVYVEPNKAKSATSDDRFARNISIFAGVLALVISIVYLIK